MSQRLVEGVFLPALGGADPRALHDAAVLEAKGLTAVSTDSFVVAPWRFPGGTIGSLAVHGSVNDLAMAGARTIALTAAFILEEGFPIASLAEVVQDMGEAARAAGAMIAAGDTKVVERGKGDGIYITTTGIGEVLAGASISPASAAPGDQVIVSGDLGRHGAAVMTSREGLELETPIVSDSACVAEPALALIREGIAVRCMRDATRGGLATVLHEIAVSSQVEIALDEAAIPVDGGVAAVCELLGLDPLYVACEGRFAAIVAQDDAPRALEILRRFQVSEGACLAGRVRIGPPGLVMRTRLGVDRILDLLSGEQLPRIC